MVFKSRLSPNLEVLKYFSLYSGLPTEAMTAVATLKVESLSLPQAVFKTYQKERGRPSQLKSRIKKKQPPTKTTTALLLPSWGSTSTTIWFVWGQNSKVGGGDFPMFSSF